MAKMTWNQYIGARGEAEIVQQLLVTGAAVDSLTAADSGWDIHLHLPNKPQALDELEPSIRGTYKWKLSGRAAHVQVKRSSRQGGWPKVNVGTARGWVTGSRAGTPTFLLVGEPAEDDDGTQEWTFVTPAEIDEWLWGRRALGGSKSNGVVMSGHRFDPHWFGWVLHMWSTYAPVLMSAPGLDDLLWANKSYEPGDLQEIAHKITVDLLSGYLTDVQAKRGEEDHTWWSRYQTDQLAIRLLQSLIGGVSNEGATSEEPTQETC